MATLATFNVLDLFDPSFEEKIAWTARMIEAIDADVLGLQEVGPPAALDAVLARLAPGFPPYRAPIVGTPDDRGIRCAILSRYPVLQEEVHSNARLDFPVFHEGDRPPFDDRLRLRRGVVRARVAAPDVGPIEVFVTHLKSRAPVFLRDATDRPIEPRTPRERAEGDIRSLARRAAEALHLRGLVDAVLAATPGAHVAVMGDLNDVAGSIALRILCGRPEDGDLALLSCADVVAPERRVSVRHGGAVDLIDHVLVTPALRARLVSARILNERLREHTATKHALPSVESDHAPLVAVFA